VKPVAEKATVSETLRRKGVQYHVYNFQVGGALYPNFTPVEKLLTPGLYVDWLNPRTFGRSIRRRCRCTCSGYFICR
jgi:hypothetical protein